MPTFHPYLNFNGNTEEAFLFYKSVIGGEFTDVMRFKDTPESGKMPAGAQDKIMHIGLPLGKDIFLMGTDIVEGMPQATFGTNVSICISPDSEEQAHKFFDGLSAGGKVMMPLEKMFWGDLFGQLTDKFGVQWMVNYSYPKSQK